MSTSTIAFLIILIVIFFYVVSIYNKLVELKNHYKNAVSSSGEFDVNRVSEK